MALTFTRKASDQPLDWRADKKLVACQARLAQIAERLLPIDDMLRQRKGAIEAAQAELTRAELEVLAGRASDAALAVKQDALLNARRAHAQLVIESEDLRAEQAKLQEQEPKLRQAAKATAHASFRAKYRDILLRLKAGLEAAVEADAALADLSKQAEQFVSNFDGNKGRDEDGYVRSAGLPATLSDVEFFPYAHGHGGLREVQNVKSRNTRFLEQIDDALKALDAMEAQG